MSQWVKCGVCDDNGCDDDLCDDDDVCGDYGVCDKGLGVVCDEYVIHHMANKMLKKFGKYWNKIHGNLGVAVVLDPRLNAKTLEALMCAQSWLSTLQEGVDREEFGTIDNDDNGEDCELSSNAIGD
ncbi:hypothetical protein Dimus_030759 [Dionaea muscipula]